MQTVPASWRHVAITGVVAVLGMLWYPWWSHTGAGPAAIGYLFMPLGSLVAASAIRTALTSLAPPDPTQSGRAQPGSAQPKSAQPKSAQPKSAQPKSAQPKSAQPGSAQPSSAQPGSAQPGPAGTGNVPLVPVARRFWRMLRFSCLLLAAGYGLLAVAAFVSAPELPDMPLPAAALAGAGVLLAMWAVARVPLGVTSWYERGQQALDRTIAFLGCATLLWHFGLGPMLTSPDPWTPAGLTLMVLAFAFAAGAITKVSYITGGPVDRAAARLIASCGLVAAAVTVPAVAMGGDGAVAAQAVCMPIAPVLIALAARRQQLSAGATPRRGNVWLPYLAVLAVDIPLVQVVFGLPLSADGLGALFGGGSGPLPADDTGVLPPAGPDALPAGPDALPAGPEALPAGPEALPGSGPGLLPAGDREFEIRLVVGAAVLVTALVTIRQYLAFRENARLLAERRESERRLRYEVTHDLLTGLANRSLFRRRLDEALGVAPAGDSARDSASESVRDSDGAMDGASVGAVASTPGGALSGASDGSAGRASGGAPDQAHDGTRAGDVTVLLVDLDDFKTVNDSLGHDVGDELLVAFAAKLREAVGDAGEVARLAGDEFAILVHGPEPVPAPGLASAPGPVPAARCDPAGPGPALESGPAGGIALRGEEIAERVMTATAAPISSHRLLVHVSVGLATAPPGTPASRLLRAADTAMHAAKARGKGNWVRYTAGMERKVEATAQLGGDLRRALDAGEFRVLYQPIVGLADGRIVGVEALVRWQHPERGTVPPIDFIPAAERTGLIVPLGRFVLRETCRQGARWLAEFGPDMLGKVAPNVSVRQLHDPDFVADVRAALADSGLPPERLVLELTESAVLRGQQVSRVLHEVNAMGVRLALDDFGTGESSLSLLRAFPAAVVKLDKSFVDGIELDEPGTPAADARQAVARAVVQLAAAFGLDTVAEGIENQEQVNRLLRLGYTVGQGYHLGRPTTAEAITARFTAERTTSAAA